MNTIPFGDVDTCTPAYELLETIKNEFHTCKVCGSHTRNRFLISNGYVWHCECGATQRVWSCSEDYTKALNFILA